MMTNLWPSTLVPTGPRLEASSAATAVAGTKKWWALGALVLAVLAVGVDGTVLSVALPTLSKALHASESDLQWFSSGYFLVLAAAMLPAGLLGDRYGRKKVLVSLLGPLRRRVSGLRLFDIGGRVHGRPGARRPGRGRADRHGVLRRHGDVHQSRSGPRRWG